MAGQSEVAGSISTEEFFHSIGWEVGTLGFSHTILSADFECTISVVDDTLGCPTRGWHVGVNYKSARSLGSFGFSLPSSFESQEEGCAWMAYGLRSLAWRMIEHGPAWFSYGYANPQLIPFIRERKEKERQYNARPKCTVDRDWMRVARRKMLEHAQQYEMLEGNLLVKFDGSLLHFLHDEWHLKVPAEGEAWEHDFEVAVNLLTGMPKRFGGESVQVDHWEGHLSIERHCYAVVPNGGFSLDNSG